MTALQNPTNSDGERQLPAADDDSSDLVTQFVRQHQTGLCRFLRLCGAGANAEGLAKEAFLVAIRRGLTTAEPGLAAAFLRQTAKHLRLRERRDNRNPSTWPPPCRQHGISYFGLHGEQRQRLTSPIRTPRPQPHRPCRSLVTSRCPDWRRVQRSRATSAHPRGA